MGITLKKIFATARREYSLAPFTEKNVMASPFSQFELWLRQASKSGIWDANAMTLSTIDKKGGPTSRIVLLKGFNRRGFVFYTNYKSDKAVQMRARKKVSLLFFWPELIREVRIDGVVEKVSRRESAAYFATRPRGSQISAWASPQSEAVENYQVLKDKVAEVEEGFKGKKIPCPPFWGGYRVIPKRFEFWHGRLNRLHDRFVYTASKKGWKHQRLAP